MCALMRRTALFQQGKEPAEIAEASARLKEWEAEYDTEKVDKFTLALLYLNTIDERAFWLEHEKGFISGPKSKAKSVTLSDESVDMALD